MFKKLLGGVLLCCVLVPTSVVSCVADGMSLIFDCISQIVVALRKPLARKAMELITYETEVCPRKKVCRKTYNDAQMEVVLEAWLKEGS